MRRNPSHRTYERRWKATARALARAASPSPSFDALPVGARFRMSHDAEPAILRKLDARRYTVESGSIAGNGLTCEIRPGDSALALEGSAAR